MLDTHTCTRFCRFMQRVEHSPWMPSLAIVAVLVLILAGMAK